MTDSTRDPAEVAAWLRLTATPGVSALAGRRLLAKFGLPQTVLAQNLASLREVVDAKVACVLNAPPDAAMSALIECGTMPAVIGNSTGAVLTTRTTLPEPGVSSTQKKGRSQPSSV